MCSVRLKDGDLVRVHTYEPVAEFQPILRHRLQHLRWPNRTTVHNYGLGAANRMTCIAQMGRGSKRSPSAHESTKLRGDACPTPPSEIRDVASVVAGFAPRRVNHFQLNCEGCEYEVLERLLSTRSLAAIDALEVQFHLDLEGRQADTRRYCAIESGLRAAGFHMAYRFPFVWERWDRHPDAFFGALRPWVAGRRKPIGFRDCNRTACAALGRPYTRTV